MQAALGLTPPSRRPISLALRPLVRAVGSSAVDLFPTMTEKAYESVHFFHDSRTGLRAIVALHDTTFGPGLGGTRAISTYETEAEAERGIVQGNDRPEPPSEEHTSELQSRENLVCRLL